MNLRLYNRIAPIGWASQTLFTPVTKEVVADAACNSMWVDQTQRQVIRTGFDRITSGDTGLALSSKSYTSPVMIGSPTISPACGINWILQVGKKRQSTSPKKVRNAQKLDTVADLNLTNDSNSYSVFSKVIGCKLSHGSSNDLYLRCRMNFSSNFSQIEAPQFVDLGLPAINTFNESGVLGTTDTKIQRSTDGSHWTATDHVFGEATAVVMSEAKSYHNYSYKTFFEIWRGNQEFER